ncbi:possible transposase (plasmid) [Rhodococcus jostii RHA1]|uniref:Possible transposase n=2 Tax=Rhodococcus jostii TaxID=132919 RepID=Q0RV96_RHOJR|nr:possible transposase [Rhodococcus jostii RHA1]
MGWSDESKVLHFPRGHPSLLWKKCVVVNCESESHAVNGLCPACRTQWKIAGSPAVKDFADVPRARFRAYGLCAVSQCERPWTSMNSGLCEAHRSQRIKTLKVSMADFLKHPKVVARKSFGSCEVVACDRARSGQIPYCMNHGIQWRKVRDGADAAGLAAADEMRFRRTTAAISYLNECTLRGLPDRVVAELIYGLQQRTGQGVKTRADQVRPLVTHLLANEYRTLEDVLPGDLRPAVKNVWSTATTELRRLHLSPETERVKDEWDATVFGFRGTLRFTKITQPWLREAAKIWAYNDISRRRSKNAKAMVQNEIRFLVMLSDSLRLQRPGDHGNDPRDLSRSDIAGFLNRLTFLHNDGSMSPYARMTAIRGVRRILATMRGLGLRRPGQPMHGLPEDFTLDPEDVPLEGERNSEHRDLPAEVMRHVCAHLNSLEENTSREVRVAVELIIDTGRRPDEICQLRLDCLERDEQGKPVLVYTNIKANRLDRRLPITEPTAAVIVAQQERVRARYPNEDATQMKLIPALTRNPHGTRGLNDDWLTMRHRDWVVTLPDITIPIIVDIDGQHVTKMLPFDRNKIFLYAYRHTYAQRHADAGVAIDVLSDLMDHRQFGTTQVYYRVGETRRRDAVDRLATMHFDRHGNKIWREARALLDSEHLRRAVGEVAVPYGTCSEPSNVAAGGHDCPVRFRCVGCSHFSTDVSYLPDLQSYLADLLRSRERLRGALAADDWAKGEAMPSDEEIQRIRRLISQIGADVDDLSDEDRSQIEQAAATVRRARNQIIGLGTPRVRQPLPDLRQDRRA